jgi:hypothetical protein
MMPRLLEIEGTGEHAIGIGKKGKPIMLLYDSCSEWRRPRTKLFPEHNQAVRPVIETSSLNTIE